MSEILAGGFCVKKSGSFMACQRQLFIITLTGVMEHNLCYHSVVSLTHSSSMSRLTREATAMILYLVRSVAALGAMSRSVPRY